MPVVGCAAELLGVTVCVTPEGGRVCDGVAVPVIVGSVFEVVVASSA